MAQTGVPGQLEASPVVYDGILHAMVEGETTDAPDLFDCEWWHGEAEADLFAVIRDGVPDTRMQAFGAQFPMPTSGG